jgi:SAM-dependent methyltransferase
MSDLLPGAAGVTLDLGCGEGRAGRELLGLGHAVVGVDRSPTLTRSASAFERSISVVLSDAADMPVADGSIALVVASMLLQDVDDLDATVLEIGRVLRDEGVLVAAIVHPFNSASDVMSIGTGRFDVSEPYLVTRRYEVDIDRDGFRMRFVSMHRPLGEYIEALHRANLAITGMREFGDSDVPWLLAFRAEKVH